MRLAAEDAEEKFPDVDDTDGLDPEAEFEEWKLRELRRVKRDREARIAYVTCVSLAHEERLSADTKARCTHSRELERREVEERRALPEALRFKEDTERAKKLREEAKANKGQQGACRTVSPFVPLPPEPLSACRNVAGERPHSVPAEVLPQRRVLRRRRRAQEARLPGADVVDQPRDGPLAGGAAEPQLWQAQPEQVHASRGPGHERQARRVGSPSRCWWWWCWCGVGQGWRAQGRDGRRPGELEWLLPLRWTSCASSSLSVSQLCFAMADVLDFWCTVETRLPCSRRWRWRWWRWRTTGSGSSTQRARPRRRVGRPTATAEKTRRGGSCWAG